MKWCWGKKKEEQEREEPKSVNKGQAFADLKDSRGAENRSKITAYPLLSGDAAASSSSSDMRRRPSFYLPPSALGDDDDASASQQLA